MCSSTRWIIPRGAAPRYFFITMVDDSGWGVLSGGPESYYLFLWRRRRRRWECRNEAALLRVESFSRVGKILSTCARWRPAHHSAMTWIRSKEGAAWWWPWKKTRNVSTKRARGHWKTLRRKKWKEILLSLLPSRYVPGGVEPRQPGNGRSRRDMRYFSSPNIINL